MTSETLKRLEENAPIKKTYAAQGSLGRNKWIAAPIILIFLSLFGAYFFHDLSKQEPAYSNYTIACIIVTVLAIIAVIIIQRSAMQATIAGIDHVPACIAKKIYGNDKTNIWYCIYTTGSRRHDIDFIEAIADKIFHIEREPDIQLRQRIQKLFAPNFATPGGTAILLPPAFSNGEKVYQKQFSLTQVNDATRTAIAMNEGRFAVLAFHDTNAKLVSAEDLAKV